jgi:hypothetical protein
LSDNEGYSSVTPDHIKLSARRRIGAVVNAPDNFLKQGKEQSNKLSSRASFEDVKAATLKSLDFIVPRLLHGGKKVGDEWVIRNPTRKDAKPGSFKVNMKSGIWKDFATGESGGDIIDLYVYINGGSNIQAKDALADMLGVQPDSAPTSARPTKPVAPPPSELREPPKQFPARTLPDAKGKPHFVVAGDEGPLAGKNEQRRHIYRQGGVAVRIKIMKASGENRGSSAYRVTGDDGVTGWQFKKPEGYLPVPYIVPSADPFVAKINQPIFCTEGEKDVETVARLGGLAFTFGGAGDGPVGCEQWVVGRPVVILADNDDKGRVHAEKMAARFASSAISIKIVHFHELEEKADVSDWAAIDGNTLVELMERVDRTEPWKALAMPAAAKSNIDRENFQAFLPQHSYIYIPTRDLWPAVTVNAVLPSVPIFNLDGSPRLDSRLEQVRMLATTWLDKHQSVQQMTWAPGEPMLIRDRLISEGGWFEHPGASCFNLYRPPTIKHGDATKAGRWVDHVKKVYPDDWQHIILWLAHHVQHANIKVNHNLVIGGRPGVGKDTLLQPVMQAVGPWNCAEVSPEDLFGSFNGYVKTVLLRVSEARDMGDVSKFQLYERMKTMGAAPPDVLRVNEKHLKEHHVVNVVGAIITTNYKTEGIYLPADDRRHYVAWSDVLPSAFDSRPGAGDASGYFDALWSWYEKEEGFADIAAYLATLDLSGFNAKAPPPKTPAFWAIVDANRPTEEAEIMDALDMLNNPDAITVDSLITVANPDLFAFIKERKNRKAVSYRIVAAGYEIVRNDVAKDGLWVVNGARKVIYAKESLTISERIKAARQLSVTVAPKSDWERQADHMDAARDRHIKAGEAMH